MSLKIVCLLKPTLPTEAKIVLDGDGRASDPRAKSIINPYDEFAVEEAVVLKEAGKASEVTLLSIATQADKEPIQRALAMGADAAVFIDSQTARINDLDGATIAAVLAAKLRTMNYDLILCGRLAVDTGAGSVPGRLAALLGIPLIHIVNKMEVGGASVTGWREADGRQEVVEAKLPAIVTADKALNKPRYPKLPDIMKAKKKPFEETTVAAVLGPGATPMVRTVAHQLPPERGPVKMIQGASGAAAHSLVVALRDEAKVL